MKFACVSDTHSWGPPDLGPVDVWLHAGDIYDGRCKKLDRRWFDIEKLYIVHGNHDGNDHHKIMQKCGITWSLVELFPKMWLVGLGWSSPRFCDLPTEREMAELCGKLLRQSLLKMKDGDNSIFLTHYCAKQAIHGMSDPGFFYESITKTIDALRPLVVIQGHAHAIFGRNWIYNGTLMLNPGGKGDVMTINEETLKITYNQRQQ
jgi:Icc-related predicted phosphoesterase